MKSFFSILLCFFSLAALAQVPQPAMLWLKGYGGNSSVLPYINPQIDSSIILCLQAGTNAGNIDSLCILNIGRTIFIKYNSNATIDEDNICYISNLSDSDFLFMFNIDNNNIILGGENYYSGKFRIHKEDSLGNVIWSKGYGGSSTQILNSMIHTTDGGYIMFGQSYSNDGDVGFHYGDPMTTDFWTLKLDSNGNKL